MATAARRSGSQLFARTLPNHHLVAHFIFLGLTMWFGILSISRSHSPTWEQATESFVWLAASVYLANNIVRQLTLRLTSTGLSSLGLLGRRRIDWTHVTTVERIVPQGRSHVWQSQNTLYVRTSGQRIVVELDYFDDALGVERFLEAQQAEARAERLLRVKTGGQ